MDRATGIFNILMSRAAKTSRNYIIDQTNVYKSARKRKLKPFADYWKVTIFLFVIGDWRITSILVNGNIIFGHFRLLLLYSQSQKSLSYELLKDLKKWGRKYHLML